MRAHILVKTQFCGVHYTHNLRPVSPDRSNITLVRYIAAVHFLSPEFSTLWAMPCTYIDGYEMRCVTVKIQYYCINT